jgi:hypothetical protein
LENFMSSPICRFLLAALCAAGLAGCGGGETLVKLQGRLVDNGQPLQWRETSPLRIDLTWKDPDPTKPGKAYTAEAANDGAFTIDGGTGKGIPPGQYTFTVRTPGVAPGAPQPPLLEGLNDPKNSPLKYEVSADANQKIVIDLRKKTVSAE